MILRVFAGVVACACFSLSPAMAAVTAFAPFVAHYQLLRDGNPIGDSVFTLQRGDDGDWHYRSVTQGTRGMAGLLGAQVEENTSFRLKAGAMELLHHDYRVKAAMYHKNRTIDVDWQSRDVSVTDSSDGEFEYRAVPGLIDRHLLPLALPRHLDDGGSFRLPVAVRNRVREERFRVAGRQPVTVPAGTYHAVRIERIDDDHAMSAWYADGVPVPVKLAQDGDDKLTLLLESFRHTAETAGND